jgi:ion channel
VSPARRRRTPRGFGTALGMTFALMLLVAGGVADRGVFFPAVLLGTAAGAVGLLYLLFPHGPQFAVGASTGLAMYACLYVVIGRAAFPHAHDWARHLGFLVPVAAFVAACWTRRGSLRASAQGRQVDLAHHLPRVGRWVLGVVAIGTLSLAAPLNRLPAGEQSAALLAAMAAVAAMGAVSVGVVVRLLVDMALLFRAMTARLSRLAAPIAAYSSLWALLVVVFGCLYRIADEFSGRPLFNGLAGPIRVGFADALHFSVVTLSTVGYGDIQPADDGVRLLASVQMLLAQLLLLFGFVEIMRGTGAGAENPWEGGAEDAPAAGGGGGRPRVAPGGTAAAREGEGHPPAPPPGAAARPEAPRRRAAAGE